MLDSDLAELYGVETKMLVRAVKRNAERFPRDFMIELTKELARKLNELEKKCDGQFRIVFKEYKSSLRPWRVSRLNSYRKNSSCTAGTSVLIRG